ncbi:MAG: NTP transferase domain-containing protein [Nanoarchaeota archaeon]|nr:NTP transferase domain-containing protein [Nanoarchaeota archaeon]
MGLDIKQAVIFCAGKGSRLSAYTNNIPKVLVNLNGKSILEYKLDNLQGLVEEVILVIGHMGDRVRDLFGESYGNLKISYCYQKELLGSGHALIQAKDNLEGRFLVLNGDDIYSKSDIIRLMNSPLGIMGMKVSNTQGFGILRINEEDNSLDEIIEKPREFVSDIANVGAYVLDSKIFDYELKKSARGEYEIVDYLNYLIGIGDIVSVSIIEDYWLPINTVEQLEVARRFFDEN